MNTIELRDFAIAKHGDQKYGKGDKALPYIFHIDMTYEESLSHGLPSVVSRACIGHDIKEDTDATDAEVLAAFGEEETKIIDAVTDEPGATRKERKAATYPKIKNTPHATAVKLCDRIANLKACVEFDETGLLKMYREEHPYFKEQLHVEGEYPSMWLEIDRIFAL